jgi:hypothetical protein
MGFEIISFAAGIPAILQAELISMQRANDIAQRIHKPIGHGSTCMRTFMGAGLNRLVVPGQAYRFVVNGYFAELIAAKGQFRYGVRNFVPIVFFCGARHAAVLYFLHFGLHKIHQHLNTGR